VLPYELEVTNVRNLARLWISSYLDKWASDPRAHQVWYVIGHDNLILPSRIVGLRKGLLATPHPEDAEYIFEKFFDEDYVALVGHLAQLQSFDD
jgi:hypothetical protein